FLPELVLIAAILLLIVWDLVAPKQSKLTGFLVLCLGALGFSALMSAILLARDAAPQNLFYGLLAFDRFSNMFRILFALVTGTIVIFSVPPIPEGHTLP